MDLWLDNEASAKKANTVLVAEVLSADKSDS